MTHETLIRVLAMGSLFGMLCFVIGFKVGFHMAKKAFWKLLETGQVEWTAKGRSKNEE